MSEPPLTYEQQQHVQMLASRLRLLMDVVYVRTGSEATFTGVAEYLHGHDIALSRSRWSYILNGHRYTDDLQLIDAISDYFDVPHAYLRGEAELAMTAPELDDVRAMRAAKVRAFSERTLGDLMPDVLSAITRILDEDVIRGGGQLAGR